MRMYEVKKMRVVDTYTDCPVGYGWFIKELLPTNTRLRFEVIETFPEELNKDASK